MNTQKSPHEMCPNLGLKNDRTTSAGYPSRWNVCYHAKGKPAPELEYQRTTCLTAQYIQCVVYKSPPGVKLPENIQQPREPIKIEPKLFLWALLVILLGVGVLLGNNYREQIFTQVDRILVPAWQQTQRALPTTIPHTSTAVATPTETQQPTVTPAATSTPEPTALPTATWRPAVFDLGTPIGGEVKFIILRVSEGSALGQFASRYNTTEAAIRAVNYNMPSVLFIDMILIIPLDVTDARDLPAFEAYQIQEGGISVTALATQLGVDPEDVSLYNHIDPDRILKPGEWILIPREQ
jgi:hypothetical protein